MMQCGRTLVSCSSPQIPANVCRLTFCQTCVAPRRAKQLAVHAAAETSACCSSQPVTGSTGHKMVPPRGVEESPDHLRSVPRRAPSSYVSVSDRGSTRRRDVQNVLVELCHAAVLMAVPFRTAAFLPDNAPMSEGG